MAHSEKMQTHCLLREGAVFRLEADGLDRTYQAEMGTVLWLLLASLQHLPKHGQQEGWVQELRPAWTVGHRADHWNARIPSGHGLRR